MNDTKITMKSLARQKADVRAKIARQQRIGTHLPRFTDWEIHRFRY